jgi:hypothetical protein
VVKDCVLQQTHQRLELSPQLSEILRYLGYGSERSPSPAISDRVAQLAARGLDCLQPRGTLAVHRVTGRDSRTLSFGNVTIAGDISRHLAAVDRIAAFVVTVGEPITELAQAACRSGDALAGFVYDAVGSWAAEAAADALFAALRPQLNDDEQLTLRFSPGYCGMDLAQQRAIFQLVQPESIGVSLLGMLLMRPVKSVSGLAGIGPARLLALQSSPCADCPEVGCHMRR